MRDIVDTTEMYLRTIYELEEEGIPPLRARIAERLEQSGPTVSQTVSRMERDGLLIIAKDRSLKLTPEGRELAIAVMRKHRLAERLLTDVIKLPWEKAHDEACRWEHVMGEEVERHLINVLKERTTSPFGNPIPGLEQLLDSAPKQLQETIQREIQENTPVAEQRAIDVNSLKPTQVRITCLNEIIQLEYKVMAKLSTLGMVPGNVVTLTTTDEGIELSNDKGVIELPDELAHAVRIQIVK